MSFPIFVALRMKEPVLFKLAPITSSPTDFDTGILSPVNIDSSTVEFPSVTTPSTGTFSPGLTRMRSPTCTSSTGTSTSCPSRKTVAILGASPTSV